MLNAVIRFALQNRPMILVASLAVMIYGSVTATRLSIDVLPDLTRPARCSAYRMSWLRSRGS